MKKTTIFVITALVAAVGYYLYLTGAIFANFESVAPHQAFEKMKEKNVAILDVRTPSEYQQGHIAGAKLIPVQNLKSRLDELKPLQGKRVLVYCRSGHRSAIASRILADNGFKPLNIKGGINRWVAEGLPVSR
ncbi:rhodanese-like domain-containing protein [Hydrogenimonas sp. SS33]|uniref:rhodanese-like domain-containing protein n=1 Tax=Hydrogenimonas leucolamina TaxID=2954236 RepID=UPI00336C1DC8